MRRAIELAWAGIGRNSPNPLVGCVLVRDGEIIGEGAHIYRDVEHAERIALNAADKAGGATLYATLEPCNHTGRTPPCTEAIIEAGVSRVVYGLTDPNPLVNGGGHRKLEEAGIEVEGGLLSDEIREQNKFFVTAHEKGRPYVLAKWAMTADGKIATRSGASRWISGEESLNFAHHLRNTYDAILVGHGTALADDPALTCRVDLSTPCPGEFLPVTPSDIRHPQRVVLDTFGATCDHDLQIFHQPGKTLVAIGPESVWDDTRGRDSIDPERIELLECPLKGGHIDLVHLLGKLKDRGIHSLVVEGGSGVHAAFLEAGLVDEIVIMIAPRIFGGDGAPSPVGGSGVEQVEKAWKLENTRNLALGDDIVLWGKVVARDGED